MKPPHKSFRASSSSASSSSSSRASLSAALPFGNPQQPGDVYTANVDGAARGNPGPASYAVIVRGPSGAIEWQSGKYIGRTTNNVAEYYGLIAALDYAAAQKIARLRVISDSELIVKQMQGKYKVKSSDLQPLHERAKKLARGLAFFAIEHVRRERNSDADALANAALDNTSAASFGASSSSAVGAPSSSGASSLRASSSSAATSFPGSSSRPAATPSTDDANSAMSRNAAAQPNSAMRETRSGATSSYASSRSAATSLSGASSNLVAASSHGPSSPALSSENAAPASSPRIAMTPHMRAASGVPETPREQRVKARYANGALHPLEPLEIAEGEIVEIHIRRK